MPVIGREHTRVKLRATRYLPLIRSPIETPVCRHFSAVCDVRPRTAQHPLFHRRRLVREQGARVLSVQTGIKVTMTRKATGEVYAQLKAEASNPKADIWYGGTHDPHLQAANEGLLQPYVSTNMKDQYPWSGDLLAKSSDQVAGVYRITLGFGYNRDLLARSSHRARLLERFAQTRVQG